MEWQVAMTRSESTITTCWSPSTLIWPSIWTTCTILPTSKSSLNTRLLCLSQNWLQLLRLICAETWCNLCPLPKLLAMSKIWKSTGQRCVFKLLSSTERVKEDTCQRPRRESANRCAAVGGAWLFGMCDFARRQKHASSIQTCWRLRDLPGPARIISIPYQPLEEPNSPMMMLKRSKKAELLVKATRKTSNLGKKSKRREIWRICWEKKLQSIGVLRPRDSSFQACASSFESTLSNSFSILCRGKSYVRVKSIPTGI